MLTIGEQLLHLVSIVIPVHKGAIDVQRRQLHLWETGDIFCRVLLACLVNHITRSPNSDKMVPVPDERSVKRRAPILR